MCNLAKKKIEKKNRDKHSEYFSLDLPHETLHRHFTVPCCTKIASVIIE